MHVTAIRNMQLTRPGRISSFCWRSDKHHRQLDMTVLSDTSFGACVRLATLGRQRNQEKKRETCQKMLWAGQGGHKRIKGGQNHRNVVQHHVVGNVIQDECCS